MDSNYSDHRCIWCFEWAFLLLVNPDISTYVRDSVIKYSFLAYFYMGDFCVQLFFVLGGFLIPLSFSGKELSIEKMIEKWSSLIILAIILTVVCFVGFSSAKTLLGELIPERIPTTFARCADDILIYLTGHTHILKRNLITSRITLVNYGFCSPFSVNGLLRGGIIFVKTLVLNHIFGSFY